MSDFLVYAHDGFELNPNHWRLGTAQEAANLPPIGVQRIVSDPLDTIREVDEQIARVTNVCGKPLQYAARIAVRETDLPDLRKAAAGKDYDVLLRSTDAIDATQPPLGVLLGYVVMAGSDRPSFRHDSVLGMSLVRGDCLTIRTAAMVARDAVLPAGAAQRAGLDAIDRYGASTDHSWMSWAQ